MSLLDRLHSSPTTPPAAAGDDGPVSPLLAALTGLWSAAVSWLAVALPALLAWATSAQSTASWGQSVRVASDVWLVLHRVAVDVPGGHVALAPIGGLALPVGLGWLGGRRIGHSLDPRHVTAAGGPLRAVAPLVGALAAGYAVVVVGVALLAHGDGVHPAVEQAVVAGLVLPAAGGLVAALRAVGAPVAATLADAVRLPAVLRRAGHPAALAVGLLVAVGAALVAVTLVVRFARVGSLYEALGAGVVGGLVVTLGQLLLVPNLVLWGVAFVSGQGFALGAGTSVTPAASDLGLLPLVPVLGAVPPPGALPVALQALVVVPVLVGAVVGWWVVARRDGTVWDALTAAALAAVVLAGLLALSGGAAGPGALRAVGPSAWKAGLLLAGELALGAGPAAWATHRRRRT